MIGRDTQRSAVYAWEKNVQSLNPQLTRKLTLAECRAYIVRVWNDYRPGTEPPRLSDGRGRRRACASRWEIKIPVWARQPFTVLHEVAHSLTPVEGHGPVFARLYFELLVHYEGVGAKEARAMAVHLKPRRVRFAESNAAPKRVTVEWQRWNERRRVIQAALREHIATQPSKDGKR